MPNSIFSPDNLLNSEIELPEDSAVWSQKISETIFSVHPYLANFPSTLNIDKFEPIKLYAKGTYVFKINNTEVIFPVIIQAKRLQPFDVALIDGSWHPVSEDLISRLAMTSQLGQGTENISDFNTQSSPIGGTRVPYETVTALNPGVEFANGGRYITASAISKQAKEDLQKRIDTDTKLAQALNNNPTAREVFKKALSTKETTSNIKAAAVVRKDMETATVFIKAASGKVLSENKKISTLKPFINKIAGENGYTNFIKEGFASSSCGNHGMSDRVLDMISDNTMDLKTIIPKILEKITSSGSPAKGMLIDGGGNTAPSVIIKIKKISKIPGMGEHHLGGLMGGGLFKSIKDSVLGLNPFEEDAALDDVPFETSKIEELKDTDTVLPMLSESEGVEPIRVVKVMDTPTAKVIIGKGAESGHDFTGVLLKPVSDKAANAEDMIPTKNRMILPPTTKFIKVSMAKGFPKSTGEYQYIMKSAMAKVTTPVELRKVGKHEYFLDEERHIGTGTVKAALAMSGISAEAAGEYIKQANKFKRVTVYTPKSMKVASGLISKIKDAADWIKLASIIRDSEESVDSVLSLGLLDNDSSEDKERLVPLLEQTMSQLSKLLVSARLGMPDLDQAEIITAIQALQEVSDTLRM